MIFLLNYWREAAIVALLMLCTLLGSVWRSEVEEHTKYRAQVEILGKIAQAEKKETEALHAKTLKEVDHAYKAKLPKVRDGAVAAYIARHGMFQCAGGSGLSVNANSSQGLDAGTKEPMAAGFIGDCATDALTLRTWQEWAIRNKLPIR